MGYRSFHFFAFLLAFVLVGAFVYLIITKGAGIPWPTATKAPPPAIVQPTVQPQQQAEPAASRSPVGPNLQLESEQRVRSGVYLCPSKGGVVYSDQPCPKGSQIDPAVVRGSKPAVELPSDQRSRTGAQPSDAAGAAAPVTDNVTRETCDAIAAAIARIDADVRAGPPAAYQELLRNRRRQLIEERQRLKC